MPKKLPSFFILFRFFSNLPLEEDPETNRGKIRFNSYPLRLKMQIGCLIFQKIYNTIEIKALQAFSLFRPLKFQALMHIKMCINAHKNVHARVKNLLESTSI